MHISSTGVFKILSELVLTKIMSLGTRILTFLLGTEIDDFGCSVCFRGVLKPCQTSLLELFCENSERLLTVTYFRKNLHFRCMTGF